MQKCYIGIEFELKDMKKLLGSSFLVCFVQTRYHMISSICLILGFITIMFIKDLCVSSNKLKDTKPNSSVRCYVAELFGFV